MIALPVHRPMPVLGGRHNERQVNKEGANLRLLEINTSD